METILFISLIGVIVVIMVEGNRGRRDRYEPINHPLPRAHIHQPHPLELPEQAHDNYDGNDQYNMDELCENRNPDEDIPYNPNMH